MAHRGPASQWSETVGFPGSHELLSEEHSLSTQSKRECSEKNMDVWSLSKVNTGWIEYQHTLHQDPRKVCTKFNLAMNRMFKASVAMRLHLL